MKGKVEERRWSVLFFGEDVCCDVGLFEVAIAGADYDLAAEEEKNLQLELCAEGFQKPDAVRLRGLGDGEAETGEAGAEQGADGDGHFCGPWWCGRRRASRR
jgi:hypothetical protein